MPGTPPARDGRIATVAARRPLRALVLAAGVALAVAAGPLVVGPSPLLPAAAAAPAAVSAKATSTAWSSPQLNALARRLPAVRVGQTSSYVKRVQRILKVRPLTGYYGSRTKAAVLNLQRNKHVPHPNGVVGPTTWKHLLILEKNRADGRAARAAKAKRPAPAASRGAARSGPGGHCPAVGPIIGQYGDGRGDHSHAGVDIGGRRGQAIYAVESGSVRREGRQSNGALRVVLNGSSGAAYYYGHFDKILVSGGQSIRAGQVIGLMGDTGSPGTVHLHFEYWPSGGESATVNPEPLVRSLC